MNFIYLLGIITLIALVLSIIAITKKCKDKLENIPTGLKSFFGLYYQNLPSEFPVYNASTDNTGKNIISRQTCNNALKSGATINTPDVKLECLDDDNVNCTYQDQPVNCCSNLNSNVIISTDSGKNWSCAENNQSDNTFFYDIINENGNGKCNSGIPIFSYSKMYSDIESCNNSNYLTGAKHNVDNTLREKINFPYIQNKSSDIQSDYMTYSGFYHSGKSSIVLMTDIVPLIFCNNDYLDSKGRIGFLNCGDVTVTKNKTCPGSCAVGNQPLQNFNYSSYEFVQHDGSPGHKCGTPCADRAPRCAEQYNNNNTEKCGENFQYGKYGYLSNSSNWWDKINISINVSQSPLESKPLPCNIIPVMGYETKDNKQNYVLTKVQQKITNNNYCVYVIKVYQNYLVYDIKDGFCKLSSDDPTNWQEAFTKNRVGLFSFGIIPNSTKVGLVLINPFLMNSIHKGSCNFWDPRGNISANADTDSGNMDLRQQVYPFINTDLQNSHYVGWLSYVTTIEHNDYYSRLGLSPVGRTPNEYTIISGFTNYKMGSSSSS